MTKRITIPLDAPALARGVGFFETLLVLRGEPILLREHYERLAAGAGSIGLPSPSWELFARTASRTIGGVARVPEGALRLSWLAIGHDIESAGAWKLYGLAGPVPAATIRRRRRGRVIVLRSHISRTSPELKTVSYIPSVLGLREAHRQGADEALFVDAQGGILEGTTSNVFAVRGKVLLTPPVSAGLLPGVMRRWIVDNASRVKLRVREALLTEDDLRNGSFLTGSLTKLAPIRFLDGERCAPPGEPLRTLQRLFESAVLRPAR